MTEKTLLEVNEREEFRKKLFHLNTCVDFKFMYIFANARVSYCTLSTVYFAYTMEKLDAH